jgi:signal transduction histidine kinase
MDERLHVLHADDEAIIRQRVLMMLGDRFHIDQASTAQAARDASATKYDAALMDIMFPDGNGIDLCREIKQQDPHCTVVISSSMESVDAWDQAFQAGADGYLEKRELLCLDPRKIALMIENLVERNRLRREAEEAHQRQAELLSILSHDVRAPFQTLLGTIELLRQGSIPTDAARNVENLYLCAKDQLSFINSLLELLRLESGNITVRRFPLDLNLPVNQCLQGLAILARAKDISLATDLKPNLPRISGDIGRFLQVVNNLVGNAIKFTRPSGKIMVRTEVAPQGAQPGAQIVVQDDGIGMTPEEQEKIFQRFHRGREKGTAGEKGSGLGLSICKEIVALHEGTIDAVSAKNHGTTMTAWFPVPKDEDLPVD